MRRWRGSGRVLFRAALAAGASALGLLALLAFYAELRLSRLVLNGLGEGFSTRVYAAPFPLRTGLRQSSGDLVRRLERLRYARVDSEPALPGEYALRESRLQVYLRSFRTPLLAQEPALATLSERREGEWEVRVGTSADRAAALEPEIAAELSGPRKIRREPARWDEIPPLLRGAVVSAEDKRFYRHWGIDPRALARAAWADLSRGGVLQGGSTITQQLAKNFFLTPRRALSRKVLEAFLAVYLELRYEKDQLLALYLNHVYLGQDGDVSVAGVKAAARFYFGKDMGRLTVEESAILAGLIRSPHRYHPARGEAALRRRDYVLRRMREDGRIDEKALREALAAPLPPPPPPERESGRREASYFVAEVIRRLLPRYGEDALYRYGLSVHTTMDPLLQAAAERALLRAGTQGALVALDPGTGDVLALAGGKEYGRSQFNRATQALRQPGSAFKPFVYGAALEAGFTPAGVLRDLPRRYRGRDSGPWSPRNFDGVYRGTTTLREALALSLNAATLELAERVGTERIIAFARRMGIESPLDPSLAMALGASEVRLIELACAYAPFANGGFRVGPRLLAAVSDAEGNVLEYSRFERNPVLEPALAYLMTSLLESAARDGTGSVLARSGWTVPTAGKTGTTNGGRDAWFIGYTSALLAAVWMGDDAGKRAHLSGSKDAIPLWRSFMEEALRGQPDVSFQEPQGLENAVIDPSTGFLARSGCPEHRKELFLSGTSPAGYCPIHHGGVRGWLRRVLGLIR